MLLNLQKFVLLVVFLASILYVGYVPTQSDFLHIILPYSAAFGVYVLIVRISEKWCIVGILLFALLCRACLLFSFPNLSDDIYRFIWDGRMSHAGFNPYAFLPSEIVGKSEWLNNDLYKQLNSPSYFTIYPPIAQLVFYVSTILNSPNLMQETIVLKAIYFLAEIVNFALITRILKLLKLPPGRILLYALNPLIIIELFGNAHLESLLISSVLFLVLFILKGREKSCALTMAGAISIKMIPALFIPALLWKQNSQKARGHFLLIVTVITAILFIPFVVGAINTISNLGTSVDLFFRKFEFNASIYYVLRYVGFKLTGYNQIAHLGPLLMIIMATGVISLGKKSRTREHPALLCILLVSFTAYLFSTTIVHPWYLSLPIALCLFTPFRFPLVWSFFIFLTYVNYSNVPYHENLWYVTLEYAVVVVWMGREVRKYGWLGEKTKGRIHISGSNPF